MKNLELSEILKATDGSLINKTQHNENLEVSSISTDSRNISEGCLFVPLIGENFDGHKFIHEAFKKGALVCLTQQDINCGNNIAIKVNDTLEAFQSIVKYYKQKFDIPFVAVTGSVGKTTTKDMIASVLEQKYKILKTEGNFNNQVGLPLTLLNLNDSTQIGIVELGMNSFGEIEKLSNIICPDTSVITNIGISHIENLGSRENILKAKLEIVSGMNSKGNIVLNADNDLLNDLNIGIENIYYYGINSNKGLYPYNIQNLGEEGVKYCVKINNTEYTIEIPVPGEHNILNSLVAIHIGLIYDIPMHDIINGIKKFELGKMRQNIIKLKGNVKVIKDCYNASPESMKAAISVLSKIDGQRKIAILGDMFELGDYTEKAHIQVGKAAANVDYLILLGSYKSFVKKGAIKNGMKDTNIICFEDREKLSNFLSTFIQENDAVLVKGSRGMKMEMIVDSLCEVN